MSRIAGHVFLLCYLYITVCALLLTVIRIPVFMAFPSRVILFSYNMTAPYQSATAPHGQMVAECRQGESWMPIDLAPFYPQLFGERNAREYFVSYAYLGKDDDRLVQRRRYAETLHRLLAGQGTVCSAVRLSWDLWPVMFGPFDALHQPVFTERLPLYTSDEE